MCALAVAVLFYFPRLSFSELREELLFMEIPVVVTATKTVQKVSDAPATVVVITQDQIRERGYNNLLDLLQDLPEVDVQNRTGEEYYNHVIIRGNASQEKYIIMRDGYRIDSPTNERIPLEENFPLFNAKRVEVVFGPASALYGADAFTGVVNIITKDASEINGADLVFSAGSFGYQNHYLNMGDRLSDNVKLSAGGHWHKADNADLSRYYDEYDMNVPLVVTTAFGSYTEARADEREDFFAETGSYSAYLKLNVDDRFTLGISESYFKHPTTMGVAPQSSYFGSDVKWETLIKNYYGEYLFDSGKKLSGKSSISYHTYELLPSAKYQNIYVDFRDAYKYARSKKFSFEQQINYKLKSHTVIGGALYENFYALPKTYDLVGRKFDPDSPVSEQPYYYGGTENVSGVDPLPVKIFELNYENYAAYLQAQSSWSDNVSSTLGVRYDYNSRYGETINPRGGVVVKTDPGPTIKMLYGEAYLSPSPFEAYAFHFGTFNSYTSGQFVSEFMSLPNPDLKPEKSKTAELVLQQDVSSGLSVELAAFYTEVDDIIQSVSYNNVTSYYIEGGVITNWRRRENVGEAAYFGGHFSLDYKKKIGDADLKLWANYSYIDGWTEEFDSTKGKFEEKELVLISQHKVKGGLTLAYGKYYITPIVRWIGETNSVYVDRSTEQDETVRSYTLVNLNAGVEDIIKDVSVSMNIRNLFDARYYNAGGSALSLIKAPQEPRRIVFSLMYRF